MKNVTAVAHGLVVHGNHLGRTIGIPTINVFPTEEYPDLNRGVYVSSITFVDGTHQNHSYNGITNVGCKPTVQDIEKVNFETYIFDFEDNVYGNNVSITLYDFIRPEMKFASVESLTEQIQKDIESAKELLVKQRESLADLLK